MRNKILLSVAVMLGAVLLFLALAPEAAAKRPALSEMEKLGKLLFFDPNLSANNNQSCATCHAPEAGYVGADPAVNLNGAVYPGSFPDRFGDRKPPTSAYAGDSPVLYFDEEEGLWIGGMFWDGRATGWTLGDPLAEQAKGPYLNPMEQAIANPTALCQKVAAAGYAKLFKKVWGGLSCAPDQVEKVYDQIGIAVAAYERSFEVTRFSSPFDRLWDKAKKKDIDVTAINVTNWKQYMGLGLNSKQVYGLALFNDESKGKCALCHTLDEGSAGYPLFTDFSYDNLGIPSNPLNPMFKTNPNFVDLGLGGFLDQPLGPDPDPTQNGKFKVPTLRNVDQRSKGTIKVYGHNGYFTSLYDIVHFYNTRDVPGMGWPAPEYAATVNTKELGNLGLSVTEEQLIVEFMTTLSDK